MSRRDHDVLQIQIIVCTLMQKLCSYSQNLISFGGGGAPPWPLPRGFAPGPHGGLCPQTPDIGSRSALVVKSSPGYHFPQTTGVWIKPCMFRSFQTPSPERSHWSEIDQTWHGWCVAERNDPQPFSCPLHRSCGYGGAGVVGRPYSITTPVGFNTAQLCCLWYYDINADL